MSSKEILSLKNLEKHYAGRACVDGLSLSVKDEEIVGLIGPNGAGKTTAFHMLIGQIRPDEGEIFFLSQNITHLPMHIRSLMGIGYLSQEPSVFRDLSVEDNLLAILETLPLKRKERKERLEVLLKELHLEHLRKKKAASLSGGERRRLEITRVLIREPKLLLLDEPFANIDPLTIAEVKKLIKLLKAKKISILITDHNAREIFSIVDRIYLMREGKVLASGSVDEVMQSELAKKHYLGEEFTF